ncbi:hypothetical protein AMIS_7630 [Actinoplanes missouriensis 431]|uniref:Uncharacterized protein n=1 Tax=Actinoplanes missouriensis (strain ATCC 14538 / DSM 43046 / CBS 188.64 / JCM 3121 / NBRC 102363 / NCIMB 12654 / NRRL B-3342 / UNCC 431) TaxID=512565 RepID=I0GYZ6_ACTM4|nr:hypothetical protein [Actinoplanes missouriensis]BAL85983.1 hypothetical protein AMIS_7630 [Actinoplanes missouriensis 431]
MNVTAQDEIGGYVEEVRQALGGLPAATREELLEDLPEHLAEVLAEGGGTLVERLGSPSAYAAELIASAGIATGVPGSPSSPGGRFRDLRDRAGEATRRADVRVGPLLGYAKASDFLILLRPGWWVLRGYLAAMAFAYVFDDNSAPLGLLPRIGGSGSELVALLFLGAAVVGSIWLGRRGEPAGRMPRLLFRAGTVALAIYAVVGFFEADGYSRQSGSMDVNYVSQYDGVQDVFVYDGQGRLVQNAQLYDQWGNPIQFGEPGCIDSATGNWSASRSLGYPYCPEQAPFRNGGATPSPSFLTQPSPTEPAASPSAPGVVNASPSRE